MKALALALLLALLSAPALAVLPDEQLADPALEARARAVSQELRCLMCQNQSIDDSNAPIARDLRLLVRDRIKAGDSDAQVVQFLTDRYGDFVRLRPPFKPSTFLLWLTPPVLLLIAGAGTALYLRRRGRTAPAAPLSDSDEARLAALLGEEPREAPR
jgi:cytochrome c-type biogenesis protein CcmH